MTETVKVKMGQTLFAINGEPLRFGGQFGADPRTTAIFVAEVFKKADLGDEANKKFDAKLAEVISAPITLAEICCTALLAAYDDEKTLASAEKIKRQQLAVRINREGMVKIGKVDRETILPMVNKHYLGSLIYPQVESMLNGEAVKLGLAEGDEPDDPAPSPKAE